MAKPEPEPFVLVLRECGEGEGRGYAMELAPLEAGVTSPPAHGVDSSSAAPTGQPPLSRGGAASRAAATARGMAASLTSHIRSRFSKMKEVPVLSTLVPGDRKGRDTAPAPTPRARGEGNTVENASGSRQRRGGGDVAQHCGGPDPSLPLPEDGRGAGPTISRSGGSKPTDAAPVRTPPSRSSTNTRDAATGAGTAAGDAAGGGDTNTSVAEVDPTATARAQILQDLRDLLYRPSATPVSSDGDRVPEVTVDIAALLAASGGGARPCGSVVRRGDTEAAGYVMPVFMVPTAKPDEPKEKEDKRISVAKIIYGVLLITVLTYVTPVIEALESMGMSTLTFWIVFGICWGLLSVGFHASLSSSVGRLGRAYIEFVAHFSLILFCAFVVYCIYLKLPKDVVTVSWLLFMETSLVIAHIFSWVLVHKNTKTSTKLA
ncbi:hypothetical protein EJB05_15187, partial [Eragrostis curvula]